MTEFLLPDFLYLENVDGMRSAFIRIAVPLGEDRLVDEAIFAHLRLEQFAALYGEMQNPVSIDPRFEARLTSSQDRDSLYPINIK